MDGAGVCVRCLFLACQGCVNDVSETCHRRVKTCQGRVMGVSETSETCQRRVWGMSVVCQRHDRGVSGAGLGRVIGMTWACQLHVGDVSEACQRHI